MYTVEYIQKGARFTEETLATPEEIRRAFIREGKTVLSIKRKLVFRRVPKAEIIAFLTAMGDLTSAGVPITKALDSVIASFVSKNSNLPSILNKIREVVGNGVPISEALISYQHIFSRTVIAMIEAGEFSGKLPETFRTAADYIESQDEVNKEMWRKLTGPLTTFAFGIVSLLFNSIVIIPMLMKTSMFKGASGKTQSSDLATLCIKALTSMSYIVPIVLALAAGAIIFGFAMYKQNQEEVEKKLVAIPVLREFIFYRSYFVAFASLAKLVQFGVKPDDALEIVERSASFIIVKKQFQAARAAIREGQNFSKGLTSLTAVERTMFDTAQSQTSIYQNFSRIADRYHRMYLQKIRSIAPVIKTAVFILVIGIFVLEFLGIILPYGQVMNTIK